jgi:hypothetical protein
LTLYCTGRYAGHSTGIETCSLQHDNSFVYGHSRKGGAVSHVLHVVFYNQCDLTLGVTTVNKMLTSFKTCYYVKVVARFILKIIKKEPPWSESASELYGPSDRRLSAK